MTNGPVELRKPIYLEELSPCHRFTSQNYALEEAALETFAAQFDQQFFHLDAEADSHRLATIAE